MKKIIYETIITLVKELIANDGNFIGKIFHGFSSLKGESNITAHGTVSYKDTVKNKGT